MKIKITKLLIAFFFMFTACQEEIVEVTLPNNAIALSANSTLTNLIEATALMDGSGDNIIDKASCIKVKLPVTVLVNGQEIIVNSESDFNVIEQIFDEFEDDNDELEIVFPITVITMSYDEIIVNSEDDLEDLIDDCEDENELDEDIECIDFKYPISFSVYDGSFQVIDVITVRNDNQMYNFIDRVEEEEVFASFNYPITMILADATEIEVNSNQELENAIENADGTCDEDDDNDYDDDDFTKDRLDTYLKTCTLVVYGIKRNDQDYTTQYKNYAVSFRADSVAVIQDTNGNIETGTWQTRDSNKGALLNMEFPTLDVFNLEWIVHALSEDKIRLYQTNDNKILLQENCNVVI